MHAHAVNDLLDPEVFDCQGDSITCTKTSCLLEDKNERCSKSREQRSTTQVLFVSSVSPVSFRVDQNPTNRLDRVNEQAINLSCVVSGVEDQFT